jgi:uncharacterized membrane protein (UPF0182 family)
MVVSFIAVGLFLFNIFKRSFKLPIILLAVLIPVYFILGTIFPSILQKFYVVPNELEKEKPYIEHNIKYTRLAYDVGKVKVIPFANKQNLTFKDIQKNRSTLENVRLWDWRPLKQTYKQLQELKRYYFFNDVDVDRYILNGRKIAVNLSARELAISELPEQSQTWENSHLRYTHGYGLVLSRVDKITTEGMPEMLVKDIPPKSEIKEISVSRPEIYYGEHYNEYVITNTEIKPGEFDYPFGDTNKYTTYAGKGGTKLGSFFKRLLYAVGFKDINILISGNITNESRVLYWRNIKQMVRELTPFLEFDPDPYLVISEGKLYWILDAFTTTDQFPYSTPFTRKQFPNLDYKYERIAKKRINYIRNSVKVVIDAYNGKMDYYIADEDDPIIKTYIKIFPGIMKKMSSMPEDLKAHIRYPEMYFTIQNHMLLNYHMTNPNVFYNNEDSWDIPLQVYEKKEELIRSYYLVTSLPDENRDEFILIMPFTPYKKQNMIGFLTAKCDMPDYGELKLYTLPKDKLSYGPRQVESRIDQDPEISKLLTLWSQKGSGVIRGNMLVIPIEESLLYIEPLYLKAEGSEMPELKRVIVSFSDKIVMERDLPTALERLFFGGALFYDDALTEGTAETRLKDLARQAGGYYDQAQQNLRDGNWAEYGNNMKKLREILNLMKNVK